MSPVRMEPGALQSESNINVSCSHLLHHNKHHNFMWIINNKLRCCRVIDCIPPPLSCSASSLLINNLTIHSILILPQQSSWVQISCAITHSLREHHWLIKVGWPHITELHPLLCMKLVNHSAGRMVWTLCTDSISACHFNAYEQQTGIKMLHLTHRKWSYSVWPARTP